MKVYFVFQGAEYDNEVRGGYLWAAKRTESGAPAPHHWQRLTKLRTGDIVLHGILQGVIAVSVVTRESYDWKRPGQDRIGWRVDCQGCLLKNFLFTMDYREQIIEYCSPLQYQPFNKNGKGNQGYLFEISRRLAMVLLRDIVAKNPDILTRLEGFQQALESV